METWKTLPAAAALSLLSLQALAEDLALNTEQPREEQVAPKALAKVLECIRAKFAGVDNVEENFIAIDLIRPTEKDGVRREDLLHIGLTPEDHYFGATSSESKTYEMSAEAQRLLGKTELPKGIRQAIGEVDTFFYLPEGVSAGGNLGFSQEAFEAYMERLLEDCRQNVLAPLPDSDTFRIGG